MKSLVEAYLEVSLKIPTEDIQIKRRLDRAYDIVLLDGYEIKPSTKKGIYQIHKASTSLLEDNSHYYVVSTSECNCPDFEKARAGLCKHRLAIMLVKEMEV